MFSKGLINQQEKNKTQRSTKKFNNKENNGQAGLSSLMPLNKHAIAGVGTAVYGVVYILQGFFPPESRQIVL